MSATERLYGPAEDAVLGDLPRFGLSYLFDDHDEPAEVTVFPASDDFDLSTNWITVDVADAVPLEDVR